MIRDLALFFWHNLGWFLLMWFFFGVLLFAVTSRAARGRG